MIEGTPKWAMGMAPRGGRDPVEEIGSDRRRDRARAPWVWLELDRREGADDSPPATAISYVYSLLNIKGGNLPTGVPSRRPGLLRCCVRGLPVLAPQ